MKKTLILSGFLIVFALPVLAQNNEVTILAGGSKAMKTAGFTYYAIGRAAAARA